ncbi:MAG TPA: hypothetical protein DDX40_06650 [Rikenellaceae bacterium]|nr:hypothetical protein [Rikenellaceae bacterium]
MLIGFSGECFGRKLADPDTLTFKKTYPMPGISNDEIRSFIADWPWKSAGLEYCGIPVGYFGYDAMSFRGRFRDQKLKSTTADIYSYIYLYFRDGAFDLVFTDITAYWRNNYIDHLSSKDDRFNRNVFWRMSYSMKILDQIRARSKELFEIVTASMDNYLEVGPPVELKNVG